MSSKGLYNCGEPGCKGHKSFSETCSTASTVATGEFPALKPFLDLNRSGSAPLAELIIDDETQPSPAVRDKTPNKPDTPVSSGDAWKKKPNSGRKKPFKDR